MESRNEFRARVGRALEQIDPDVLAFDESEFWMIRSAYEYVDFYATSNRLWNTMLALPLARGLHDGVHRKSSVMKDGVMYRLPYLIHPLQVCRLLIDLQIPISREEEDILIASALCHDMIEDIPFANGGRELYDVYHLDPRVYDTVLAVSKKREFTEEQEREFIRNIVYNKLAMLVKLSDRGNNVEDLYNMSLWKIHEYAGESRDVFLPMCVQAKELYPEIAASIGMLGNKIETLITAAEILADQYNEKEQELLTRVKSLREENQRLRTRWQELWNQ